VCVLDLRWYNMEIGHSVIAIIGRAIKQKERLGRYKCEFIGIYRMKESRIVICKDGWIIYKDIGSICIILGGGGGLEECSETVSELSL